MSIATEVTHHKKIVKSGSKHGFKSLIYFLLAMAFFGILSGGDLSGVVDRSYQNSLVFAFFISGVVCVFMAIMSFCSMMDEKGVYLVSN